MARLSVMGEKGVVCSVTVWEDLSIGRAANNDLQIPDSKVSRRHCLLERRGRDVVIRDLDSSNGTFVNGNRVSETVLEAGDQILLGETTLIFEKGMETVDESGSGHGMIKEDIYRMEGVKGFFHHGAMTSDAVQSTLERLSTLFEIGNIINTTRDSEAMTEAILRQIVRIIKADRYFLFLKQKGKGEALKLAAVYPLGEEKSEERFPVSETLLYSALREGASILSVDTPHDKRFMEAKSIVMYGINSVMCVPVRSHDKVLGVIQVDSRDPARFFTKEDLNLLSAIGISAGIAIENLYLYEDLKRLFLSTVRSLVAALEASDPYTGGHSVRVAAYAKEVASRLALRSPEIEKIELAAYLHDIGKIGIPTQILTKPSSFNEKEYKVVREHPVTGYEILTKVEGMEEIASLVRHHHERYDGKGYPDGLRGERIPLGSRILCVVDTYDAMVTDRPYRKGMPRKVVLQEILDHAGSQFDPRIARVFAELMSREREGVICEQL